MHSIMYISHRSVSVIAISSRYRFFGIPVGIFNSRFGICCRYFKLSRYRFGIFGISLCVKAPRADPKILLPSQPQILTENPCQRSRRTSADLPVAEGGSGCVEPRILSP